MTNIEHLNPMQQKAVLQTEGPVLLLAGAGSGKTRVLVHRIAHMIEDCEVKPWNIMAITFTNKAAGEMKARVDALVPNSEQVWVMTFHATCVRILHRYIDRIGYDTNFTIYDIDDQKTLMRDICKRLNIDTKQIKERSLLAAISAAKNDMMGPAEYEMSVMGDYNKKRYAQVYHVYQEELHKNNALDFDDLLLKTVELFKKCPEVLEQYQEKFRYIMVDEYQDTNTVQFEFIRLLSARYRNLCVVGDDDQSIYKFRGANIRNILDFEKVFPDAVVIKLEQNYRSTQTILEAANSVIHNNTERKDKSLWTEKDRGERIHFRQLDTSYEEAEYIASDVRRLVKTNPDAWASTAVLYRTNAQSRQLEERFVLEGIPYSVVGGVNFYSRREIKDILCYLKTIDNAADDLSVKRIINVPKRGIGATTVAKVDDYAHENDISFYEALKRAEQIPGLGKTATKLLGFVNLIQALRSDLVALGLGRLMERVLTQTDYLDYVAEIAEDDEDNKDRRQNLDELVNKIVSYAEGNPGATLNDFLNEVALVADIDNVNEADAKVLLMTLHAAKGLEFDYVYLAGMEDGLFPSERCISDDSELEEERRLAYVGITRARLALTLTAARQRMNHGETQYFPISRFVREIPRDLFDIAPPEKKKIEPSEPFTNSRFGIGNNRGVGVYGSTANRGVGAYGSTANRGAGVYGTPNRELKKPPVQSPVGRQMTSTYGAAKTTANALSGLTKGASMGTGGKPDYEVGDRVKHVKFGEGTVLKLDPGPKDYQVTVMFDSYGSKVMYAGFAKLVKV